MGMPDMDGYDQEQAERERAKPKRTVWLERRGYAEATSLETVQNPTPQYIVVKTQNLTEPAVGQNYLSPTQVQELIDDGIIVNIE